MVFFAGLDWGDREHELVIRDERGADVSPHLPASLYPAA